MKYHLILYILLFIVAGSCKEKNLPANQKPGQFVVTATLSISEKTILLNWTPAIDPEGDVVNYSVVMDADTLADKLTALTFAIKNFKYHSTIKGVVTAYDSKGGKTQAPFSISIENVNLIEDSNFEKVLIDLYIDTDQQLNGVVEVDKNRKIEVIYVNGKNIKSLKGIEIFTELNSLDCSFNQIKELDLSKNEKLTNILAHNNELEKLELGNKEALVYFTVGNNKLSKLDVSSAINLLSLSCEGNLLTGLDVTKNTKLTYLGCGNEKLLSLDVSNNLNLERLYCTGSRVLKEIKVPKENKIKYLDFQTSSVTSFDFNACTELLQLDCNSSKLTSLDIEKCTKIQKIQCAFNDLKTINLKTNTALKALYCVSVGLESIDLSNNRELTELLCRENKLKILDIRHNSALSYLDCRQNKVGIICVADLSKVKYDWKKDSNADYFVCD